MTRYKTLYRVMKTADDSYVCTDKKNGNAFLMADAHFVVRISQTHSMVLTMR